MIDLNYLNFNVDEFSGFLFFMFIGGVGFSLILGLARFLLFTFIERREA